MLNIFRGKRASPDYRLVAPPKGEIQTINVSKEVSIETMNSFRRENNERHRRPEYVHMSLEQS